jgi:beta-phosphoglucomutase
MKCQNVLFDMDGVIVDSEPLHAEVYQRTLRKYGYELTLEQYKAHIFGRTDRAGLQHYFDALGISDDPAAILAEKSQAYLEFAADKLVPYQEVVELIHDLASRRVTLGLVTGALRAEAELTLHTLSIRDHFAAVIAAEDIVRSKPDPEGYLKGARALGASPETCVVIEDAPSGVQAARAAGMHCVAVTSGHSASELQDATLVIDRLRPGCIDDVLLPTPDDAGSIAVAALNTAP